MKQLPNILFLTSLLAIGVISCQKNKIYDYPDGWSKNNGSDTGKIAVDTSMSRIDKSRYADARVYPGMVDSLTTRVENYPVTINANYDDKLYFKDYTRIVGLPIPCYSTGLFAPAGELIAIDVPAGAVGLSAQVGAHTDVLSSAFSVRQPLMTTTVQLFPGTNYVRNLFGGTVYIKASRSLATPVQLSFTGAVVAPDFILGTTNPAAWAIAIQATTVPWAELRSNNVIFTLPTETLKRLPIADPTALMTRWDEIFQKDVIGWLGLSQTATDLRHKMINLPTRIIEDIQPAVGYAHAGYPIVTTQNDSWYKHFTSIDSLNQNNWGIYEQIGRNFQSNFWNWSGLENTTNSLFAFQVAQRQRAGGGARYFPENAALMSAFAKGLAFTKTVNASKDFNSDGMTNGTDGKYVKLLPFVQLFEKGSAIAPGKDGYGLMTYLNQKAREATRYPLSVLDMEDFVYENASDYFGKNLLPFFKNWGIQVSLVAQTKVKNKGYSNSNLDVWNYNPIVDTGGTHDLPSIMVDLDRTGWTATATHDGIDGTAQPARNALDGDINSYWGTPYSGSGRIPKSSSLYLQIDCKQILPDVYGLYINYRPCCNWAKKMQVYISDDGITWNPIPFVWDPIQLAGGIRQNFKFPSKVSFRYVRFFEPPCDGSVPGWEANNVYGNGDTDLCISEAGVFTME